MVRRRVVRHARSGPGRDRRRRALAEQSRRRHRHRFGDRSRPLAHVEWSLGTPFLDKRRAFRTARSLPVVSQLAPQLQHVIDLVRPVHGVTVTSVVACGNLPDLRSLAMLLIEEMDLEVETLDSRSCSIRTWRGRRLRRRSRRSNSPPRLPRRARTHARTRGKRGRPPRRCDPSRTGTDTPTGPGARLRVWLPSPCSRSAPSGPLSGVRHVARARDLPQWRRPVPATAVPTPLAASRLARAATGSHDRTRCGRLSLRQGHRCRYPIAGPPQRTHDCAAAAAAESSVTGGSHCRLSTAS